MIGEIGEGKYGNRNEMLLLAASHDVLLHVIRAENRLKVASIKESPLGNAEQIRVILSRMADWS